MAKPVPSNGTKVAFSNTPQAKDDAFVADESIEGSVRYLDVMANDLGGNAKALYSVDDGTNSGGVQGDLLNQDAVGAIGYSHLGAKIWITADGKIAYDSTAIDLDGLAAGEHRIDTFTYAIRMANGAISWATATVDIVGSNDAPVITFNAGNDVGSVSEDALVTTVSGQLAASDVDNDATATWSVLGANAGAYGSFAVDAAGVWTYALANTSAAVQALASGESHDETFTVKVTDEFGASDTQTVTIKVTGSNDAPVISFDAGNDVGSAGEDALVTTVNGQLAASDVDNGATATWSVLGASTGAYGSFAVDAAGLWTYALANTSAAVQALASGESHDEIFTVQATDEFGATDTQTVTIKVTGSNDAPVISYEAGNAAGSVTEDALLTTVTGQLAALDVDAGATVVWSLPNGGVGAYGAIAIDELGQWTYSLDNSVAALEALDDGASVVETFTARVTDEYGAFADQTITVTVNGHSDIVLPPNTPPDAVDDVVGSDGPTVVLGFDNYGPETGYGGFDWTSSGSYYSGYADVLTYASNIFNGWAGQQSSFTWLGNNDVDIQGLRIADWNGVSQVRFDGIDDGVVVQSLTVPLSYNSSWVSLGFESIDRLDIVVTGGAYSGNGIFGTGWWLIDDLTFNEMAPAVISEDSPLSIAAGDLLANDSDLDGDTLTVTAVSATSAEGAAVTLAGGDVLYDPSDAFDYLDAGETAVDSFSYTITDTRGATDTATVTLTVVGVNDAPEANDDGVQTDEGSPLILSLAMLLGNDADAENHSLAVTSVGNAVGGSVALDGLGNAIFTPASGLTGAASFDYAISDGHGGTDSGTVNVTVNEVLPPVLFTEGSDSVDFAAVVAGSYLAGSQYDALDGDDVVALPADAAAAAAAGYDLGQQFSGGQGDDTITGSGLNDLISGGEGADVILGGLGSDLLIGGIGDDRLDGGESNDTLVGGAGNDVLVGGLGGGLENDRDTVDYSAATGAIAASLVGNAALGLSSVAGDASVGIDQLISVENVVGSSYADSFLIAPNFYSGFGVNQGIPNSSELVGPGAVAVIEGMGGDDVINGNNEVMISYIRALDGVTVDLQAGTAMSSAPGDAAGVGIDSFFGVDQVRGSSFNDVLLGSDILAHGVESFRGGMGDDYIDGRGGAQDVADYSGDIAGVTANLATGTATDGWSNSDILVNIEWLRGSSYADNLTGDALDNWFTGDRGADVINGGAGQDWTDYRSDASGVTVNLSTGSATDGSGNLDALTSIENVRGSLFDDVLVGDGVTNRMRGLAGDDILNGGAGSDWADYQNDLTGVTVDLSGTMDIDQNGLLSEARAVDGWGDLDSLISIERVSGSAFDDVIVGNGANNRLQGNAGDDLLSGRAGSDTFVFVDGDGNDTITDFGAGLGAGDVIDFTGLTSIADYSDLLANHVVSNGPSGIVFDLGGAQTLTLSNVNFANLNQDDFLF